MLKKQLCRMSFGHKNWWLSRVAKLFFIHVHMNLHLAVASEPHWRSVVNHADLGEGNVQKHHPCQSETPSCLDPSCGSAKCYI